MAPMKVTAISSRAKMPVRGENMPVYSCLMPVWVLGSCCSRRAGTLVAVSSVMDPAAPGSLRMNSASELSAPTLLANVALQVTAEFCDLTPFSFVAGAAPAAAKPAGCVLPRFPYRTGYFPCASAVSSVDHRAPVVASSGDCRSVREKHPVRCSACLPHLCA